MATEQDQFLSVVDRDTAEALWHAAVRPALLDAETVPLAEALGRVLAREVRSPVDVPGFDRSNFDGFAVRAEDTYGAAEETERRLRLNPEELATGVVFRHIVEPRTATPIATGGMLPRGADAVVMIEQTRQIGENVLIRKAVAPGSGVTFAGTDVARGELVLGKGSLLTARETGVLAAIGLARIDVVRRPRVAILSTGDELVPPGAPQRPGAVYDSNSTVIADAVRELGSLPIPMGIIADAEADLAAALDRALAGSDLVVLSGGTSKGAGDLSYRVLARRTPGIVVHGVALKPGKPVCLGAVGSHPVAILPGFPTSAIFTFHEFIAPLLSVLGGRPEESGATISATLPDRITSERGRAEYVLVGLLPTAAGLTAFPMGKGSGSVTAMSRADGFVVIPKHQEYLEAGETVTVEPIGRGRRPADLVVIGSHCNGLDALLGRLHESGIRTKTLWVGSQGGLASVQRQECDLAGIHLFDPGTGTYNTPFLGAGPRLVPGYRRMQGIVFRAGDPRFDHFEPRRLTEDSSLMMVNRNRGSGTRALIDELLGAYRPPGHAIEARSHHGVAAAVVQGRADWGLAIAPVAKLYGLGFIPWKAEHYDFAVPASRWDRHAVIAFRELLSRPETRRMLSELGFWVDPSP